MSTGVMKAPAGAEEAGHFRENRVHPRHTCEVTTLCQPAGGGETRWQGTIREVSQGGVRLVLPRRFERNSCLAVELPGKEGDGGYTVFVRVIHLRSEGDGSWA